MFHKADLRKHIREIHTNNGALKTSTGFVNCKYCDKALKPGSLNMHVLTVHLNIRKYKCDLCYMTFKTSGHLTTHKHGHTKTRPYACNLCSIGYFKNYKLQDHFEKVHGIVYTAAEIRKICGRRDLTYLDEKTKEVRTNEFTCSQCDFSATQNIYLQRHLESMQYVFHSYSSHHKS